MKHIFILLLLVSQSLYAYARSEYGVWRDLNKDCKNTRINILEQRAIRIDKVTCNNIVGVWNDYYTQKFITNESLIDLDHVIPLSYADKIGASKWDRKTKIKFANDPNNLVITHRSINRQKGDKGISKWLPVEYKIRCDYLLKWYQVSNDYGLILPKEDMTVLERNKPFCEHLSNML